jgi:hypothetical protein
LKIFLKPRFAEGKSRKLINNPIPNCKLDNTVTLKSKTVLFICRIYIIVQTYIGLGKTLQGISKYLGKIIWAIMKEAAKLWCVKNYQNLCIKQRNLIAMI